MQNLWVTHCFGTKATLLSLDQQIQSTIHLIRAKGIEHTSLLTSTDHSRKQSHGERVKSLWARNLLKNRQGELITPFLHIFPYFQLLIWAGERCLIRGLKHNNGSIHPAATSQGGFIKKSVITYYWETEWIVARNDGQLKWPANIWIANDHDHPSFFFFFSSLREVVDDATSRKEGIKQNWQ